MASALQALVENALQQPVQVNTHWHFMITFSEQIVEDEKTGRLAKPVLYAYGAVALGGPVEGVASQWAQPLKSGRTPKFADGTFDQQALLQTLLEIIKEKRYRPHKLTFSDPQWGPVVANLTKAHNLGFEVVQARDPFGAENYMIQWLMYEHNDFEESPSETLLTEKIKELPTLRALFEHLSSFYSQQSWVRLRHTHPILLTINSKTFCATLMGGSSDDRFTGMVLFDSLAQMRDSIAHEVLLLKFGSRSSIGSKDIDSVYSNNLAVASKDAYPAFSKSALTLHGFPKSSTVPPVPDIASLEVATLVVSALIQSNSFVRIGGAGEALVYEPFQTSLTIKSVVLGKSCTVNVQFPAAQLLCNFCLAENAAQTCSKCKYARYCNATCQKSHWSSHKSTCKPPEEPSDRHKPDVQVQELADTDNGQQTRNQRRKKKKQATTPAEEAPVTEATPLKSADEIAFQQEIEVSESGGLCSTM